MLYLTLRQYEYVVAVAEAGSVTEAAIRVGVSQPSLSVAISQGEVRLGASIFTRRRGAPIEITPFGHRFVADARALLGQARALEQARSAPGPFVLGCFADIAPWVLAPALDVLRPDLEVAGEEARFAPLAEGLATGRLDLAISYDIGFGDEFARRTLRRVRPVAFMPPGHPLAGRSGIGLAELLPCPLILFSEPESEGFMRRLFEGLGQAPVVAQRVSSLELMRSLAAHGAGVGLSYSCPPGAQSYDGRPVVTVPITSPETEAEIKLIWSKHNQGDARIMAAAEALSAQLWRAEGG